jgi:asparagine synthase (glutamine-hydrolysing)
LLQSDSLKPIQTFTIGFEDKKFNEAKIAEEVARQLGTDHSTLYCTEIEFEQVIPYLPEIYDEPFGDSSAIPTYLVSKLAKSRVKVALSGDGGDELFGGYSKYKFSKYASLMLSIPYTFRKLLYNLSFHLKPDDIEIISSRLSLNSYTHVGSKYLKFQQTLLSENLKDFFYRSSSYLDNESLQRFTNINQLNMVFSDDHPSNLLNFLGKEDILSYLPGDILTKVDRASMNVALESREPFLDQNIIDFAFTIPEYLKISPTGESKYILKQILKKYISHDLISRPKQGFTVPIDKWLKGNLKKEVINLANDKYFFKIFNLNQEFFIQILDAYFSGNTKYNPHFIWFVYCLFLWYKKWL